MDGERGRKGGREGGREGERERGERERERRESGELLSSFSQRARPASACVAAPAPPAPPAGLSRQTAARLWRQRQGSGNTLDRRSGSPESPGKGRGGEGSGSPEKAAASGILWDKDFRPLTFTV